MLFALYSILNRGGYLAPMHPTAQVYYMLGVLGLLLVVVLFAPIRGWSQGSVTWYGSTSLEQSSKGSCSLQCLAIIFGRLPVAYPPFKNGANVPLVSVQALSAVQTLYPTWDEWSYPQLLWRLSDPRVAGPLLMPTTPYWVSEGKHSQQPTRPYRLTLTSSSVSHHRTALFLSITISLAK